MIDQIPVFSQYIIDPPAIVRPAEEKPKPIEYVVQPGDTLISIAEAHSVSIERIWSANSQITNPDVLNASEVLRIPRDDEVLPERPMPVTIEDAVFQRASKSPPSGGFSSFEIAPAGWYPFGQCTQYVWTKRPVGKWGNAISWVANARRDGLATGTIPQVGAIGQRGNHVVYIEAVEGNRVYLSERNWDYRGSYRERWANASDFIYIY